MKRFATLLGIATVTLGGCASSLTVKEIANNAPAGTEVDGVPFRVPRTYTVTLYKLTGTGSDAKSAYTPQKAVAPITQTVPDMDHLYVLGFHGEPLSNPTVNLTMNSDSTIQNVSLSSSPSGQAALNAVGAQLTAIGGALTTNKKNDYTAQTTYESAKSTYYTSLQAYCKASTALPIDGNAVRVAAQAVHASEVALMQARSLADSSEALPFSRLVDPQTDVGLGCAK
jgi:hypothetical protein